MMNRRRKDKKIMTRRIGFKEKYLKKIKLKKRPTTPAAESSDEGEVNSRPKKTTKKKQRSKTTSASMATKSESDNSQDGTDSDGEVVQPPKKKTKQPLKEVKSLDNGKKKTKQKVNYPKYRKIDKSTGADYQITYGGLTVKGTEFKIKTNKPKPKSYPDDDESEVKVNGQVKKEQMSDDDDELAESRNNENNNEKVNGTTEDKEAKPEPEQKTDLAQPQPSALDQLKATSSESESPQNKSPATNQPVASDQTS